MRNRTEEQDWKELKVGFLTESLITEYNDWDQDDDDEYEEDYYTEKC